MVGATTKPTGPPQQPMQKGRPNSPSREAGSQSRRPGRLGPVVRSLISLWIVWHFSGVFLAALSLPPSSQLVVDIAQRPPMQWYLDALYLNQGHSFFAPEVGPGHVIHYELLDQSGRVFEDGELPSLKEHWPRLRYHRHFMLADQAGLPSDNQQFSDYWQRMYLESYARHLLRLNEDAQTVRVRRYAHWPLPRQLELRGRKEGYEFLMQEFAREGRRLDDQGYELLMDVRQRRADLAPEPDEQSLMWQGGRSNTAGRWMGAPR